jgi:integrase
MLPVDQSMPKITKRHVDSLKPKKNDYFIWDDDLPGFGMRVWASGHKVYVLQYRDAGNATRRLVIGEHGTYTPDQARAEAAAQRAMVLASRRDPSLTDPAQNRRKAKLTAKARLVEPTVAELAEAFLAHAEAKLKPSTVKEYRRLLGITPIRRGETKGKPRIGELRLALGRFRVAEVTRAQVSKIHLGMKSRPYMANRALAALSALFTYAEAQGYRDDLVNPCKGVVQYREHRRERLLSDAEYAALGRALRVAEETGLPLPPNRQRRDASGATAKHRPKAFDVPKPANKIGIAALRFLILTGWREGEALTLKWSDLNSDRGTATLLETKTGRSERELGAPALLLLEELRTLRKNGNPYVFFGAKEKAHFADTARLWDCVRYSAGLADVRLHDLRHGYASVGLASGLTLPVIGALLGHTDVATTSRYAHLADSARKRAADLTAGAIAAALGRSAEQSSPGSLKRMK